MRISPAPDRRAPRRAGLGLVEVLVALAIVAGAAGIIATSFTLGLDTAGRSSTRSDRAMAAAAWLADVRLSRPAEPLLRRGAGALADMWLEITPWGEDARLMHARIRPVAGGQPFAETLYLAEQPGGAVR